MSPWHCLETFQGQIGLPIEWRASLGDSSAPFQFAFLQPTTHRARTFPCARQHGYFRPINFHEDGTILSPCHRLDPDCPSLTLTQADITLWQLDWSKLGRALCHALGLDPKSANLGLHNTSQIGSWSSDAVPVILTVQNEGTGFNHAADRLAASLRRPFIFLAPTSSYLTAATISLLTSVNAAFFSLDTIVQLSERGTLHARKPPGELFAQFTPQPKELDEDVARRVLALVHKIDPLGCKKLPTLLTVFRLYCIEELSAKEIARECECSKAAIVRRLIKLRAATGADPRDLRRLSPHLAKIEDDFADSRADHLHRQRLID